MTLFADLMAACVLIGLCPDASQEITLPKDDGALLEYKKPDPIVPKPVVNAPIPDLPPVVIEKIIYVEQPAPAPLPQPEPTPAPVIDPQVVAYLELLNLRRSTALSYRLDPERLAVNASSSSLPAQSDDPSALDGIPSISSDLDFGFDSKNEYPTRYQHSALDSGFPVNNARIMRSDRYINAVYEGGVNSQLASGGEVILQVTDHVYGYHGRNILIPKGSRIICSYEVPDLANSTRLDFECNRILIADTAVEIYQLKSKIYDAQANLGVSGLVDNRWWDRYGEAILITGLSVGARIAAGSIPTTANNANLTTSINAGTEELSQRLGEITASILENQINTKPIIRIAQGTTVVIKPANDWYIAEPRKG